MRLRLIEREKLLKARDGISPFEVVFIFSDRSDGSCYGESIACDTGIPYVSYDIRTFHKVNIEADLVWIVTERVQRDVGGTRCLDEHSDN